MADDDIVQLIDDSGERPPAESGRRWKIAVIDDEPAVHDGTRFALSDYKLNGQGLQILSAYSAAEGRELMRKHAGRGRGAARRHHGDRHRRPWSGRVHPQ